MSIFFIVVSLYAALYVGFLIVCWWKYKDEPEPTEYKFGAVYNAYWQWF